jgi:hypothetical protein
MLLSMCNTAKLCGIRSWGVDVFGPPKLQSLCVLKMRQSNILVPGLLSNRYEKSAKLFQKAKQASPITNAYINII